MFKVGQVVHDPLMKRTLKVQEVRTFENVEGCEGMVLLIGTRLKKDGEPYNRRVHNKMTHMERFPLQVVKQPNE